MKLALQVVTLIAVMGIGMGMGLVYDLYTWFRRRVQIGALMIALLDLLYWVLFAFIFIDLLIRINEGRFRLILFALLAVGGFFYFLFFSKGFLFLWEHIFHFLLRLIDGIRRFLLSLYRLIHRLVFRPIFFLLETLLGGLAFLATLMARILLFFLRRIGKSLYALFRYPVKIGINIWGRLKGR